MVKWIILINIVGFFIGLVVVILGSTLMEDAASKNEPVDEGEDYDG